MDLSRIDFALNPLPDLHEVLRELRRTGRVAQVRFFGKPNLLLTRYDDVMAAYRDEETFPSPAAYDLIARPVMGKTIQCMTGEEHTVHRALVRTAFKPAVVAGYRKAIVEPHAHALIDRFAARGEADLVHDFTRHFSFGVIARILGIPAAEIDAFHRWVNGLFAYPSSPEAALAASAEFSAYVRPLLEKRRSDPRDDLLSALVAAEIDGERLGDEEILSFVRLLFPAGADTTYLAIGSMLCGVLGDAGIARELAASPGARAAAVEEALRWETPVALQPRMAPRATTWRDLRIPAGPILFGTTAANRDPDAFSDPDTFDVARPPARPIASFGQGRHFCLGMQLARLEMEVALGALLERLPGLRLDPDRPWQIRGAVLRGPNRVPVRFEARLA